MTASWSLTVGFPIMLYGARRIQRQLITTACRGHEGPSRNLQATADAGENLLPASFAILSGQSVFSSVT